MRRMHISKMAALSLFLAGTVVCACSVKEDRDGCPCWLDIDLAGCSHYGESVQLKGWSGSKGVIGTRVLEEDYDELYEAEVPRGVVSYCAYTGSEDMETSGTKVMTKEGSQCGSLYAYRTTVDASGETAYDRVRLHKQFATVTINLRDEVPEVSEHTAITVRSHWQGMEVTDLSPAGGSYSFAPERNADGNFAFRVSRQGDDTMSLEISVDGRPFDTIDLGKYIADTGYDWNAEDLDDIWIGVDWAKGQITVIIDGWKEGHTYDIVL